MNFTFPPASFLRTNCLLRTALPACSLIFLPALPAADTSEIVVVSSHASDDYLRTKQPDGSLAAEYYAFGEGGAYNAPLRDPSFDHVNFKYVVPIMARALAGKKYLPTRDPAKTNLLIMVYWGMTTGAKGASGSLAYQGLQATQSISALGQNPAPPPPGVSNGAFGLSPMGRGLDSVQTGRLNAEASSLEMIAMENARRDITNEQNAGILGYDTDMRKTEGLELTPMRWRRESLVEDLEDNRYFVVLMAYDFQLMWKEKKRKLLWDARFSIPERGNEFDRQLESMAQVAARHFGRNTNGIQRLDLPTGQVTMEEVKILGSQSGK